MTEVMVTIYSPDGRKVGHFPNAVVEMTPEHYYSISGRFCDADGKAYPKVEYNPQVLPYTADISASSACGHKKISYVYVQRGRQPVLMTGRCLAESNP